MPDKPGDRFKDKSGNKFVLDKDPKDGHLRPYPDGKQPTKSGCTSVLLFIAVIAAVAAWTAGRLMTAL